MLRAIDIDDAIIEASRMQREAAARAIKMIRAQQRGEAFKDLENAK